MTGPGRPSLSGRLNHLLRRPLAGATTLSVTFDDRDHPPWTAELAERGKPALLRSGQTLEHAILAVAVAAKDRRSASLSRRDG